ncbi:XRE family transcriptional regulator [Gordonibacter sp. 28C]|nr:XRE family transcriptional regulator [Gordonibacter sp. 28C]
MLGRNVTRLRKQAKITKQKFALMVNVGRPFLNRIENGTADPRLSVILRLAAALDTTPQELLTDQSEAPTKSDASTRHARLG